MLNFRRTTKQQMTEEKTILVDMVLINAVALGATSSMQHLARKVDKALQLANHQMRPPCRKFRSKPFTLRQLSKLLRQ